MENYDRRRCPGIGPAYCGPGGCIAVRRRSRYRHRFGGDSWSVVDPTTTAAQPTVVLTLDLADPLVSDLCSLPINELPLCSYIAYDIGPSAQVFQIHPTQRRVSCVKRGRLVSNKPTSPTLLGLAEK